MQDEGHLRRALTSSEYIQDLFRPSDRLAVVIKHANVNKLVQRIAAAELVAAPQFQAWLRFENVHGANIYVGMNPLKSDAHGRTKGDIDTVRHLYLDLDQNGGEALARILNDPNLSRPNYVLNTSIGKHQVIWNVEGFNIEEAERVQRAMAFTHGADRAATDVTRVLRIPGFTNRKYDPPYQVRAQKISEAIYTPGDFCVEPHTEASHQTQSASSRSPSPSGHVSQSELDWSETLCRLEQNENPDSVREWLKHKRPDKPNPEFYAALTVRKAVAELERRRTASLSIEHC